MGFTIEEKHQDLGKLGLKLFNFFVLNRTVLGSNSMNI